MENQKPRPNFKTQKVDAEAPIKEPIGGGYTNPDGESNTTGSSFSGNSKLSFYIMIGVVVAVILYVLIKQ